MKKALFLDRDGVINVDNNYVYKISNFEFLPDIFDICSEYQAKGYIIIVITNQAGIARGYYSESDFAKLTVWMLGEFQKKNIHIEKVYHCPHHPDFTGPCSCRKPNIGMILAAQKEFNIDLANSVLIGDKQTDIDAGKNANIGQLILK